MPVSGAISQQKAKGFGCLLNKGAFKASSGRIHHFKAWYRIVRRVKSTSADAGEAAAWLEKEMPRILK